MKQFCEAKYHHNQSLCLDQDVLRRQEPLIIIFYTKLQVNLLYIQSDGCIIDGTFWSLFFHNNFTPAYFAILVKQACILLACLSMLSNLSSDINAKKNVVVTNFETSSLKQLIEHFWQCVTTYMCQVKQPLPFLLTSVVLAVRF